MLAFDRCDRYDRFARLAARLLNTPTALVSLVGPDRQVFLGAVGLPEPWASQRETPLSHSVCRHVVTNESPLVLEDVRRHPLLSESAAVRDLDLVAYLGTPLRSPDGTVLGALCTIDRVPRSWTDEEVEALADLAVTLTDEFALWETAETLKEPKAQLDAEKRALVAQAERTRTLADAFALQTIDDVDALSDIVDRLRGLLGLDIGIVSRITPSKDRYEVVACAVPDGVEMGAGDVFAFGQTYCSITLHYGDVLAIDHMAGGEHSRHPCYEAFGLEAYIGAPIHVAGSVWGTVNFSSPTPQTPHFTEADRDLVRLAARWIGGLVTASGLASDRAEAERLADVQGATLGLVQRALPDALVVADPERRIQSVNPAFSRLFGLEPADVVGHRTAVLYADPSGFAQTGHSRFNASAGLSLDPYEVEYRRADGTVFTGETVGSPVRDSDGRLVGYVGLIRDVSKRREMEDELYHQAHHDALTGLPNRALFTARLEVAVERTRRGEGAYAVLFLDLDRFKTVNDTLGHTVGDRLLQEVAGRLVRAARPADTVARLGGDEFAILLEGVGEPDAAEHVAARVQDALAPPVQIDEHACTTGASVGVVVGRPDHDTADSVLMEADLAMYAAKGEGRGRAATFRPGTHTALEQRLRLELDLPAAVERGELRVAYQPVVQLSDGALAGFEALVRWDHPALGLLYPDAFIDAAEKGGEIVSVDRWVLREACRQMTEWERALADRGERDSFLLLNVNCTGRDLLESSYADAVGNLEEDLGFAPRRLLLEITESLLMEDPDAVATVLRRLQRGGVRFCLDDFGTGYSSLATLHALPVDRIKVDRSFVTDMDECTRNRELVRTVVELGHILGKSIVAEGIEKPEHLAGLQAMGCQFGQGYLFSKPLWPEDVASLIAAGEPPWQALWTAD
ncbi:EAL domain-containing protein [Rubrivirga marina]|uniref:Diguanylate cyclase n=1 Tax=Rubrivirga marina TaxID=1196024 RepID=A0A271J1A7_9BACT|nr:EAL domain-containing protein [Rubrivirga marina]PAP77097.1 hypothetical protein BSZ37_12000 [Rubrivirga marina]